MKNRPFILVILSAILVLEPLTKILYFKYLTGFGFEQILDNISSSGSFKSFFDFWLLFPLAGISLYFIRVWSFYLFILIQIYSIYTHATYEPFMWPYLSRQPFSSNILLIFFNVIILIYVSLPNVRKYFFEQNLRWWESRKRYNIKISCLLTMIDGTIIKSCEILNLSDTGFFVRTQKVLEIQNACQIDFEFKEKHYTFDCVIMSAHKFNNQDGVGLKIKFNRLKDWWRAKRLVYLVKTS